MRETGRKQKITYTALDGYHQYPPLIKTKLFNTAAQKHMIDSKVIKPDILWQTELRGGREGFGSIRERNLQKITKK